MVIFKFSLEISRIARTFPMTPSLTLGRKTKASKTQLSLRSTSLAGTPELRSLLPTKN